MAKVWTVEDIKSLILENDVFLKRGLLAIYSLQTDDEKASSSTKYNNSRGFNGVDGTLLCSFAEQLKTKGYLSPKQMVHARRKLVKYAGQMLKIANGDIRVNESDLTY